MTRYARRSGWSSEPLWLRAARFVGRLLAVVIGGLAIWSWAVLILLGGQS